jgi:hypothetical protein
MKPNFMLVRSRSRPLVFLNVPLGLRVLHLAPQPLDLELLGFHLPLAGKACCGSASKSLIEQVRTHI